MGVRKPGVFQQWLDVAHDAPLHVPELTDIRLPVLVVGAGPAGLAAMAALSRAGVRFEGIESHSGVGGIWDAANPLSSVYEGMHTVTSRHTTHLGRPIPEDGPLFLPHRDARQYLAQFAEQEGLVAHLRLNTRFEDAVKTERGTWLATLHVNGQQETVEREYRAIVIATGSHNRNHRIFPRSLWDDAGGGGLDVIHAAEYEDNTRYVDKRVLVIGVGNSGTDIADKVSTAAKRTLLSVRTPPWINPATVLGTPCDKMAAESRWLPHWYEMASFHIARRLAIGSSSRLGLPKPRHALLDRLPVNDRGIVRAILDGRVQIRSNVSSLEGGVASFEDVQEADEPVDAVIFCTGYARQYPLLPPLDADGETLRDLLTFFLFHRDEPGLAVMTELVGTWSCWPIFVQQARALATYFAAEQRGGRNVGLFNARRCVPTPDLKGKLFGGADAYHVDYRIYLRVLRDLVVWLSGQGRLD